MVWQAKKFYDLRGKSSLPGRIALRFVWGGEVGEKEKGRKGERGAMGALVEIQDICKIYNPGENEVKALNHVKIGRAHV